MDVREKLVELVDKARRYAANKCHSFMSCAECDHYGEHDGNCRNTYIAESLIANGVAVQQCGEWEEIEDDWNMETIYKCSACKEEFVTIDGTPADNLWNYCPHCGAKMMPQPPKGE